MNSYHNPVHMTFRKRGLPKRLRRIPGGCPGLVSACNVVFDGEDQPMAKVGVFRSKAAMRYFYKEILPFYRNMGDTKTDALGPRCMGFVNKLAIENYSEEGRLQAIEVDRNYFCFVGLVEGHLTAEILAHEAVHVGFAWDYRTRGKSRYSNRRMAEENVCYPAGIFVDQVLTFIKQEKLREV